MTEITNAATITVGSGSGFHFSTIQDAINESISNGGNDIIVVNGGIYDPFYIDGITDLQILTNGSVIIREVEPTNISGYNASIRITNAEDIYIENLTIDGNDATINKSVGIFTYNTTVTIHNCTIQDYVGQNFSEYDNNASETACFGIGVADNVTCTLTNSTLTNNQVGMVLINASLTMENTTITGKDTNLSIGIYMVNDANVTAENCTITGHTHTFNDSGNISYSGAVRTETETDHINISMSNCTIYDNARGLWIINGTTLSITNSSLYNNNESIKSNKSITAIYNWWGTTNGPNSTTNIYNQGLQGDRIGNNCTYLPWLNASHTTGSAYAPIMIGSTGFYGTLSAAIENATTGNELTIAAGLFNESADITKSNMDELYLNGTTKFGSIFNDTSLTFNNVTNLEIRNLTIRKETGSAITLIDFDNTLIEKTKFDENGNGINCVAQGTANTIADTSIQWCEFDDCTNGVLLSIATANDSEIKELYILNNTFHDNTNGINTCNASTDSSYINASNLTITDNIFYSNVYGMRNYQNEVVNASYNYWFNHQWDTDKISAGPSGEGIGNGDKISENVTFSPFYAGHTTVIEDISYNITVEDTTSDIDNYGFDWNNNGTFENWTTKPISYINHTFTTPANQTVRLQINGSGPYIGLFQAIVEDNVSYTVETLTTGYNIIGIVEKEISCDALVDKSTAITRISYWNETDQSWSESYIAGWSEPTDPQNYEFTAGEEALITVSTNDSFNLYGFYPTTNTDIITLKTGYVWIARTGSSITAESLGENLTVDGVNWSQIRYWREGLQMFENAYLPGGSGNNFTIDVGDAVLIGVSADGNKTFSMEGW